MLKKLKFLLIILLFLAAIVSLSFFYQKYWWKNLLSDHQVVRVVLKKHFFARAQKTLLVEVVNSQQSLAAGLSGRPNLSTKDAQKIDGLLFIFPGEAQRQDFWMKAMQFKIDICWLNDAEIFACSRDLPIPDPAVESQDLPIYSSPQTANLVLETLPGVISSADLDKKLFWQPKLSLFRISKN